MPSTPAYALKANPFTGGEIMRYDINEIERFIADNTESAIKSFIGVDMLVRTMATIVRAYAQQKSGGPVAPGQRSVPALAYRIPVQRITGRYFAGWYVRRVGPMSYFIGNNQKEAYLIETGLHMRVRRPILKMSLIAMLKFFENSRTEQRFLPSMLAYRRNSKGQYASVPFNQRLAGTDTLGGMAGPRAADDRPAAYLP